MKLFRNCSKCKRLIPQGEKCHHCEKIKHALYDDYQRDNQRTSFYKTSDWNKKRLEILKRYNYIDLFEYYTTKKIIQANTVHHIIPLEDNPSYALSDFNLIPLSHSNHSKIHKIYNKSDEDKTKLQRLLKSFIDKQLN